MSTQRPHPPLHTRTCLLPLIQSYGGGALVRSHVASQTHRRPDCSEYSPMVSECKVGKDVLAEENTSRHHIKKTKQNIEPAAYGGPQVTVLCVLSQSLQDYIFCQSFSLKRACCILGFFCLFFETSFKFSTDSVLETHFFFAVCQFENNISIRSPQLDIILTQFY